MRYCDAHNDDAMVGAGTQYWMPMDQYIGGIEHAILHLLYARFWTKVMRDLGLVKIDEPFTRLLTQGMVLNHIYSRRNEKGGIDYFWPHDVDNVLDARRAHRRRAPEARRHAGRVRRRRHDVEVQEQRRRPAGPDRPVRRRHGAAVRDVRVAAGADARVERRRRRRRAPLPAAPVGLRQRAMPTRCAGAEDLSLRPGAGASALRREVHARACARSNYDYERMQYNTVVSGAMKMLNALEKAPVAGTTTARRCCAKASASCCACSIRPARTSPTRCGTSSAMREQLGDLLDAPWPQVDEAALVQDEIELVLQVNGKLRGAIKVPADAEQAAIEAAALASPEFARFADGKPREEGDRRAGPAGQHCRLSDASRARVLLAAAGRWPAAASSCAARPSCVFARIAARRLHDRARRWPTELRRNIAASTTTRVVEAAAQAQVVLRGAHRCAREERRRQHGRRPGARSAAARTLRTSVCARQPAGS